jgi:hypothetical protein
MMMMTGSEFSDRGSYVKVFSSLFRGCRHRVFLPVCSLVLTTLCYCMGAACRGVFSSFFSGWMEKDMYVTYLPVRT